jgi:RNA polymerase sigma factor (sigma-70 family)
MPPQHRSPLVRLAADRGRYEHLVLSRFRGTLSREDAEDVVSEALLRVTDRIPADAGPAWFARVVLNRAEDFRRARDGRPRTGAQRAFVPLKGADVDARGLTPDEDEGFERELARRTVHRALNRLPHEYRTLIRRRHLHGAPRREIASALGMTVTQYEKRHAVAWSALELIVARDEPTPRCRPVRRLPRHSPHVAVHVSECLNCRLVLR